MLHRSLLFAGLATIVVSESAVLDLVPSNFDEVVFNSKIPTLVEFFAPWCGHCQSLAPVYEQLASAFEFAKDKVQIAKVDAAAEKALGQRFDVQGFPTLKFFDGIEKDPEDYKGGRDLESLTAFIVEKTGVKGKKKAELPSKVVILTDSNFNETVGADKHALVAFTASWCGHCKKLAPIWEQLAEDFANEANVLIAKVDAEAGNSKATAQQNGVSSYPTIKFFTQGDKNANDYTGGRSEEDFVGFLNEKAGTHRVVGGGLDLTAGTVDVLDKIVSKFLVGTSLTRSIEEAKKEAALLKDQAQGKYAEYYVKVFSKVSTNEKYAKNELARLQGMLKKGGLASTKVDELSNKVNVLRKFMTPVSEDKEGGKDEL